MLLIMMSAACAPARYSLNLAPDAAIADATRARARAVDADLPPADFEQRATALQMLDAAHGEGAGLPEPLAGRLVEGDLGLAWETVADGAPAFHELTAGLIDLPFGAFLESFEPAGDWGRKLAGYLGGERSVDQADEQGRATLQRERMIIAMPWYAIGGPDMDMSKHEVIERGPGSATVLWYAAFSENRSVSHDDGYLVFKGVEAGGRERTLVLFDSIHQIDTGWGGALLPRGARSALTLKALRDTFLAHIDSYRAAAGKRR